MQRNHVRDVHCRTSSTTKKSTCRRLISVRKGLNSVCSRMNSACKGMISVYMGMNSVHIGKNSVCEGMISVCIKLNSARIGMIFVWVGLKSAWVLMFRLAKSRPVDNNTGVFLTKTQITLRKG